MTKLIYTKNNLIHTFDGPKDDILAQLIDIVDDNMTIVIDELSVKKIVSTTNNTTVNKASSPKKRTYVMSRSEYRALNTQVIAAWNTKKYTIDQLHRKFSKVPKSTITRWIREAKTSPKALDAKTPARRIVHQTVIPSTNSAHNALAKFLDKDA
jgi:hypothetical protein